MLEFGGGGGGGGGGARDIDKELHVLTGHDNEF